MEEQQYPMEEFTFKFHAIEEIRNALDTHLKEFFRKVQVDIVECPDISTTPFNLAATGFGGGVTGILDLGGVPYLVPNVDRSKVYDLAKIVPKYIGSTTDEFASGFYVSGAGAGPFHSQGSNCEMIVNMFLDKDGIVSNNKSRVVLTCAGNSKDDVKVRDLVKDESSCALLSNLMVSSGIPGKVLRVKCSQRIDPTTNLTASLRSALTKEFGTEPIGLGGLFLVENSQSKIHVMPNFCNTPLITNADVHNWLQFYNMDPPMLFQSIIVSTDPGLDLRVEHSHGWSLCGKFGGHYHYDLSPQTVEYTAYYAVAQKLWRIDRPTTTHGIGRD